MKQPTADHIVQAVRTQLSAVAYEGAIQAAIVTANAEYIASLEADCKVKDAEIEGLRLQLKQKSAFEDGFYEKPARVTSDDVIAE